MDVSDTKLQNGNCTNESCADLSQKIADVSKIIADVTEKYASNEIFISFNGGKDCTVLLDIYLKYSKHTTKPIIVYIQPKDPFPEVEDFIKSCEKRYDLRIKVVRGNIKVALEKICSDNPDLKVVIMGCRRTDPYCETLQVLQPTDDGWPELLRVNPLLDWNYKTIWQYIKHLKIDYCKLYDEGYTSIGDRLNTKPNPSLLEKRDDGVVRYMPASELVDDELERSGRF